LHPLIQGLIQTLPPPGSEFAQKDRAKWLQAADSVLQVLYKEEWQPRPFS
jgi:hypothetical protein